MRRKRLKIWEDRGLQDREIFYIAWDEASGGLWFEKEYMEAPYTSPQDESRDIIYPRNAGLKNIQLTLQRSNELPDFVVRKLRDAIVLKGE